MLPLSCTIQLHEYKYHDAASTYDINIGILHTIDKFYPILMTIFDIFFSASLARFLAPATSTDSISLRRS